MQTVSSTFSGMASGTSRKLATGILVSWDKQTASGVQYMTIGTSKIGGNDMIKSTGGGTIAQAQQYKYAAIPASGIISWSTAMSLAQFPYGVVQRQADVVIGNTSTAYLPASGTALGPNIDSGRPVIIQAGFGAETIPMFTGYSDSPVNDIGARTTSLHCYDAVDYLNSYPSTATPPQQNQRGDQNIATLLAEAGFAPNQYVLERSLNSPLPYLDPYGRMIGDIIRDICTAEGAIFFADEAGILHFWNRQHFSNNATPVATLTYSNMQALRQQNAPIFNYVAAKSSPLALVSGLQNVYTINQPYYIQASSVSGINNVYNPGFEVSTSGWSTTNGTIARTNTYSFSGTHSLQVYDDAQFDLTAASGKTLGNAAQFMYKTTSGVTVEATIGDGVTHYQTPSDSAWHLFQIPPEYASVHPGTNQVLNISVLQFSPPGNTNGSSSSATAYIDCVSDYNGPFFDGDTPGNNANFYTWSGAAGISKSYMNIVPQYLSIQLALNHETYSLNAPVASGLNNPSIGAQQSFYSFSSVSGIGGIFGTDLTANISLVSYTVSGTTAFLKFLNNGTQQAYLTNLRLYGQVASPPAVDIEQSYIDNASIRKYRLNPANNGQIMTIVNDYIPTAGDASGVAQYIVQGYSTPHIVHTIESFSLPHLQFGNMVSLYNRDTGETRSGFILGISNSMSSNGDMKQRLTVQELAITNYFTIGASSIGSASAIAP